MVKPPARVLRGALEQLSIYVPVLLMGMLALASYWLLQATPEAPTPRAERTEVHQPHHVMHGFSVRTHGPGGTLKAEVRGNEARLFPDDGSMEIDAPRVRSFSPDGVLTTLVGDHGWTNKANDEFVLKGNATVVRHATSLPTGTQQTRLEFQSQHLRVFTAEHRVVSDTPVVLLRGIDRITANQMDYNDEQRVAVFTGRVRAQLSAGPRP